MNILVITGDAHFKPGHPRFDLQAAVVERLVPLYVSPRSLFPKVPEGTFDVVTAQDPFFRGLLAVFLAKRLKARLNVQVHSDLHSVGFLKHVLAQIVLRHAHSVRVVSEKVKAQVEKMEVSAPVHLLPVYIDIERFKQVVRRPDASPTVLWLGRFERDKDPLRALVVFTQVKKKLPDAKLIMLGEGSMSEALRMFGSKLLIEFPGWQDPAPYLARAHVVLSTSPAESFGASMVEALAAGVPVVAPDVGVAREAGATIAPRDHLADAVIEVLNTKPHATLALTFLAKEAWQRAWLHTLS